MSKPQDEAVKEWLSKKGYSLEYATMYALKKAGLLVSMGMYIQNSTGVMREIDVTAFCSSKNDMGHYPLSLRLICECKYSNDKPWVILQSDLRGGLPVDWHATPHTKDLDFMHVPLTEAIAKHDCWHFTRTQQCGHSIVQAFQNDNKDVAYETLHKIAAAAWDWTKGFRGTDYEPTHQICIPAIIIDGSLYEAWCPADSDEFKINKINRGRLSWLGLAQGTMIDVVTKDGLAEWASQVKATMQLLVNVFEASAEHASRPYALNG